MYEDDAQVVAIQAFKEYAKQDCLVVIARRAELPPEGW
jgi:hypothetical protein